MNEKLFSYMVAYGELLVEIGLILGTFTAAALFFGAFMNLNYMLADTTITNPTMYTISILLMIAGTNSSTIGLDYFVQPMIKKILQPNTRKDTKSKFDCTAKSRFTAFTRLSPASTST